jgi:transketolase
MSSFENPNKEISILRSIVIDSIEEAGDGHPGAALSISPVLYSLYREFLRVDFQDNTNAMRDRFVLSCGHTAAALYATLHLMGFGVSRIDLQTLRRGGSCPGHPELGVTPGVEISTGPLGFGFSASLGMALGLKMKFSKEEIEPPRVVVMVSDGDLQEGVSSETVDLAVQFDLSNLIAVYDSNRITIDGETKASWSDSVPHRFSASGWDVFTVEPDRDGDVPYSLITETLRSADASDRPALVVVKTTIGYGVPELAGTSKIHGSALGSRLASLTRNAIGIAGEPWSYLDSIEFLDGRLGQERLRSYSDSVGDDLKQDLGFPEDERELVNAIRDSKLNEKENLRSLNGKICNLMKSVSDFVVTGSADLTESTGLLAVDKGSAKAPLSFGVREKAMGATAVGLALEGFLPIFSTYLAFSDLQRLEVRMASLMKLPVVFLWTHDTVSIGPDGPTHQPVEQLASLRCVPGLSLVRPASLSELKGAWIRILADKLPVGLVISRSTGFSDDDLGDLVGDASKGGYVVSDWESGHAGNQLVVISAGSEVSTCLAAKQLLGKQGVQVRIVSVPSTQWFWGQQESYRESIVPGFVKRRLIVEAGTRESWWRFSTEETSFVTVDSFGESNSQENLASKFGLTASSIAGQMLKKL